LYANNPYDPVVGISTPACSGFTEIMTLYNSCICYACKVKVTFYKGDNVLEVFGYIAMPDYENFGWLNVTKDFLVESPMNVKYRMLTSYLVNQQKNPVGCSMYRTIKGMFHKTELEPNVFGCTRTSGPPSGGSAEIRIGATPSSTPVEFAVRAYVTIVYYCNVYGRFAMQAA